jgi:hypothetical protein
MKSKLNKRKTSNKSKLNKRKTSRKSKRNKRKTSRKSKRKDGFFGINTGLGNAGKAFSNFLYKITVERPLNNRITAENLEQIEDIREEIEK